MNKAKFLLIFTITILALFTMFFLANPSYQKSIEAKFYYKTGVYDLAYLLSKEAFELDNYNKMATTIMTHSKLAMEYESYIKDSKKYTQEIKELLKQNSLSKSDKAKIKLISEIMVKRYQKLTPSVAIDKNLKQNARKIYENFRKILEKVDS